MIILDSTESNAIRSNYINKFIKTSSCYYKENIEQTVLFSDGLCYVGYLWDCFLNPIVISEYKADQLLKGKNGIYIMWDIHSCERILTPDYWKFPKSAVLYTDTWSEIPKDDLPEDVYVFDATFRWSIIYTHETDEKDTRFCLCVDNSTTNFFGDSII